MLTYTIPYFAAALLIALLGVNRSMGFWGYFFASLLLTPVMGVLLLLVSGSTKDKDKSKETQKMDDSIDKKII